jgi:antitoxin component YwqK of YwqJK toxin-antitoxin module
VSKFNHEKMKKTLLFIISLHVLISCNNKKTQNFKTGSDISLDAKDSTSKESVTEVLDDKLDSLSANDKILREYANLNYKVTAYYDNGQISSIVIKPNGTRTRDYVQGADIAEYVEYFENGKMESRTRYMGTKKEGERICYYPNGQLRSRDNYMGDLLIDESIRYHENGQLMYRTKYVYGKPEGQSISYYENGKIKSKENFVDGQSDGEFVRYYENGQLEVKINYAKGKHNGKCTWYFSNGNIDKEENSINGQLIGESKRYYENGTIKQTTNNDTRITIDYDKNGNPVTKVE